MKIKMKINQIYQKQIIDGNEVMVLISEEEVPDVEPVSDITVLQAKVEDLQQQINEVQQQINILSGDLPL